MEYQQRVRCAEAALHAARGAHLPDAGRGVRKNNNRSTFYFCRMPRAAPRTPILLFGFLVLYILLQSAWWMWLLLSKDRDIFALQQQLIATGVMPHLPVRLPKHTLMMVVGEGLV